MFDVSSLLQPHLRKLQPYSSARDEYSGKEGVFLDANENPLGSITDQDWNRYPDPYQKALKNRIGDLKGIDPDRIFLGNGSDEPIDLLFRAFCQPGTDNVIINPPTYGMYQVSADINNVETRKVLLDKGFDLDTGGILEAIDEQSKLIFICSPNNPTGNDLSLDRIKRVIESFKGIVVVDEAYIDFSSQPSLINELDDCPNLIVLQTFSKAWGLAGLRLGMAFASREIISILNKIKAPYNLSGLTQETVLRGLENSSRVEAMVKELKAESSFLQAELKQIDGIERIYPSSTNFLLVKMKGARAIYERLVDELIIVRDRSNVVLCDDCLRITVGTRAENQSLIEALKRDEKSIIY